MRAFQDCGSCASKHSVDLALIVASIQIGFHLVNCAVQRQGPFHHVSNISCLQDKVSVVTFDTDASTIVKAAPVTSDIAPRHWNRL